MPAPAIDEQGVATLQTKLLDRHHLSTRRQLRIAVFDYIEAFYNPTRRHSALGCLSPASYEKMTTARPAASKPMSIRAGQLQSRVFDTLCP